MTNPVPLFKNRGEWAEIVAVFFCLGQGRIPTVRSGERCLEPTGGSIIIAEMHLERNGQMLNFVFNRKGTKKVSLDLLIDNEFVENYPHEEVLKDSDFFINEVKNAALNNSKGTFSVPSVSTLIDKYYLGNGKSKSSLKQDLELVLIDADGMAVPVQGFSIKSFVGGDPTLFNPSRAARFKFRLDGLKSKQAEAIAKQILENKPKSWVQKLYQELYSINAFTQTVEVPDPNFKRNLELLDANMPSVMGLTLLQAYCFGDMSLEGSLNKVILSDPLGYGRDAKTFYTYRIKHFLRAAALGFSSSKPWNGKEGADGGMIFVDKNWNFSCMMSSRKDFENYLLKTTRFESPSSSERKHGGYGKVTTEWHGTFVDLLLQIRESDPFQEK